jgi:capsular exopolysaccharide synthesis family protein
LFLDVLQAGGPTGDAAELLSSPRMLGMVQSLIERYDFVLIDSPPIFPVTDSTILATFVDGVVLVVRGQRTDRQVIREALERLRFMGARIAGVVLNGVDPDSSDYHRYSYYFGSERVA